MKSGFHDKSLTKATSDADLVFWKGENDVQLNKLIDGSPKKNNYLITSIDSFVKDFKNNIIQDKDVIVMMSNGNFDGLSGALKSNI